MSEATERSAPFLQQADDFAVSVLEGLSRQKKSLPCRFFYDAKGSALFEDITRQPEYYPTRVEIGILTDNAMQMLEGAFGETVLVEFGSGSSIKTEILLGHMRRLHAYVPVDISESALTDARERLAARFFGLNIQALLADFSHPIILPPELAPRPKLGFFPGSTIGNFVPAEATRLLRAMRETLSPRGKLIIGVDLKKDVRQLVAAYDDANGVTAAFNLNLLARINRELDATFDLQAFRHVAIYEPFEGRIEMHLVSVKDQDVWVAGRKLHFRAAETIHTENAYKYTIEEFHLIAQAAGWTPRRVWNDDLSLFSVHELVAP
ncbi:L-histidine N(alpha)-methyltransferase [Methylocystis suflitae]|uniref:L-histidine N(alpha)-methyltransferase n=1 Tax=Methylocystis suflitae TaxID=2951405 RepID=UPI00210CBD8D|nr:L-histidine N(alpha)-methyltransferase [Methylocystis suflitae]MCQ4189985.1 L-histidine N(alpha)-methyltransferase [Methylocystis suflitae]